MRTKRSVKIIAHDTGGYWREKGRLQNYTFSALNSLQKSFTSTIYDGDDDDWKIELHNFCSTAGISARPIRASIPLGFFSTYFATSM